MNNLFTHIYTSGDQLPDGLLSENFFHCRDFFELSRQTPRHRPYLVTVEDANGTILSQLLAHVRYRSSFFPPYFYMHCHVLGEGAYRLANGTEASVYGHAAPRSEQDQEQHIQLFDIMLQALKERMTPQVLYIEVSNLSQKMFGYRQLRSKGFFPVKWMSIHNSLHSRKPEERISPDMMKRIQHAKARGVTTKEVENESEFKSFMLLLRHHNWLKPHRYIPANEFFRGMMGSEHGKLFITQHHHHIIGCSVIMFSQGQAFLWYSAFRRKSFAALHPADITIWNAIKYAHEKGFEHIYFMDVGLPFKKDLYRDFILKFGGKPVSTLRWFHFSIKWVNQLLGWFYT